MSFEQESINDCALHEASEQGCGTGRAAFLVVVVARFLAALDSA
ncbi:hypothetical protein PF003_g9283 [Phytophthora fragariae]|nr:hypothetical protein PF003_g9283 [Phytophthora fragariae]